MAGVPEYSKELRTAVQFIHAQFDLSKDTTGKKLGTLPKGAQVIKGLTQANVTTVFDGTTPTVLVGTSGDTDAIFASADIAPGTAAIKEAVLATIQAGVFKAPATADTDLIFTVGGGGSNTVGVVNVCIGFYYPVKIPSLL